MANGTQSQYLILPSSAEDANSISQCNLKAFANSFLHQMIFPKDREHLTPVDEVITYRANRVAARFRESDFVGFKAVHKDRPDVVIGYANWYKPRHYSKKNGNSKAPLEPSLEGVVEPKPEVQTEKVAHPACLDLERYEEFMAALNKKREEVWGDNANFWYLAGFAVDPDYQRQGIARLLIETGTRPADEDGMPIYLESSPEGAPVYPRFGFEICEVRDFMFNEGLHTVRFMIRQPVQRKELES